MSDIAGGLSLNKKVHALPLDERKSLERIQDRVLWLSTRMIDHANRERENLDGLKVGGHQASSANGFLDDSSLL